MRILQAGDGSYGGALAGADMLAGSCGPDGLAEALKPGGFDGVAAAPSCTASDISAALRAGVHVLAEGRYPGSEWEGMAAAAKRGGAILGFANPDRFSPGMRALRERAAGGTLEAMEFRGEGWTGGGLERCIDSACWLSGAPPRVVFASGTGAHMAAVIGFGGAAATVYGWGSQRTAGAVIGGEAVSADPGPRGGEDPLMLEVRAFAGGGSGIAGPREAAVAAEAARAALLSGEKGIPVYLG